MEKCGKGTVCISCGAEIHPIFMQMSVFYVNIGKFGVHFGKMWKRIVYIQCVAEIHPIFIRMSEFT